MASFTPKKIDLSKINNGQKYEVGDGISSDAINAPIEAAALLQSLATNPPDYSQAGNIGTPIVEIGGTEDSPKFVFKNLKGDTGKKGDTGARGASGTSAVLENENHNSDIDGYTQNFINSNFSNPNLLINGNFKINQRGQERYDGILNRWVYTVDRWALWSNGNPYVITQSDSLFVHFTTSYDQITQIIPCDNIGVNGKRVTVSCKIKSVTNLGFRIFYNTISNDNLLKEIPLQEAGLFHMTVTVPESAHSLFINFTHWRSANVIEEAEIEWVKLEVGEVPTALHPRPFSEELLDCSRYFYSIKNNYNTAITVVSIGYSDSVNRPNFIITLPCEMRTKPTFLCKNELFIYSTNLDTIIEADIDTVSLSMCSNIIEFRIKPKTNVTLQKGEVVSLVLSKLNDHIDFDAEIYW
jgi:hypothetical protein